MKIIIRWRPLALVGLVILALLLRLYGLNWDQGNNFHPDERQILFHVVALSWPTSWAQFLDPVQSPLNPHFFAYGSFPLYLLAFLGHVVGYGPATPNFFFQMTILGRIVSALFDTGTVLLTGLLGLALTPDERPGRPCAWGVALLAAALVAFTPLELQLSHFYAVDTILLFFVMLTLWASVRLVDAPRPWLWALVAGVGYGLAIATKFSATPLAVPIFVAVLLYWFRQRHFLVALSSLLIAAVVTLAVMLLAQPYMLLDMHNFVQQVGDQSNMARGMWDLPYVRQFAGTIPYLYEAQNMFWWGMGVTLSSAAVGGVLWLCWRLWRHTLDAWLVLLAWIVIYSAITGNFYVKFMRYMLPIYPALALLAAGAVMAFFFFNWSALVERAASWKKGFRFVQIAAIVLVLGGTMFQGLALLHVYSVPNTRVQASQWMYTHLPKGSVLTYEQWDDALPVAIPGYDPAQFVQASYIVNGQTVNGLDLYGDDTTQKAEQLARLLPTLTAITMPTDRLDKSIPRLPARYPLTIHYYQLLFSGQLGFHLAEEVSNRPSLFGITLDDSSADESYSVFDHPTAKIFVRDTPYPYTEDQLVHKLLEGIQLPPLGARLSGTQASLLLTPQQIDDNQSEPSFGEQFPRGSLANALPVLAWWLAITLLGWLVFPLAFVALRPLADRGYLFSKLFGIVLFGYLAWLLASLRLVPFTQTSLYALFFAFLLSGIAAYYGLKRSILSFVRGKWRLLLGGEILFSLAFLALVGIRAQNPDLWQPLLGGEKPMEVAFLNAVLRSRFMPPLDPWFSGGYINYYYYGYALFASFIKLTGIVPLTAYNLVIPTLFALTLSGAVIIVYSFSGSVLTALLGGYFVAVSGNLNGILQLKEQFVDLVTHLPLAPFNYWQSSRIIDRTINEFPFWSFLFADLHPHVMNMPITVGLLSILAALLLTGGPDEPRWFAPEVILRYLCAAFLLGTLACVNPWDMPAYSCLLVIALVGQRYLQVRRQRPRQIIQALLGRAILAGLVYGGSYLFFVPFYASYQQLYVNGTGLVQQGSDPTQYLTVFGLWLFVVVSFLLVELFSVCRSRWSVLVCCGMSLVLLVGGLWVGIRLWIAALLLLGLILCLRWLWTGARSGDGEASSPHKLIVPDDLWRGQASTAFLYLLILAGLAICLGIEVIYIRDFLDGGGYARMNTVFKFSIQAWILLGLVSALIVQRLWQQLRGVVGTIWRTAFVLLLLSSSIFLVQGTISRINDHEVWVHLQAPPGKAASADYAPSLDGFAFAHAWYPGDAQAIDWLNDHVSGSPVILETEQSVSYQWIGRVSVYTGLPSLLGWPDHVSEQRYANQPENRLSDVNMLYTIDNQAEALVVLHYYHVRYIYVGPLEQQIYGAQSPGLQKFSLMVGDSLRIAYQAHGVTIYEVVI
ncbi:DUF2298 domain-containing protein [Tengunoibacter tsumagoiensis]|uniref:DUF2298 domain-containing protein n=1 Tax=Tengunoibacter tsumagoiensis TaxID=2014871 RepID=UPI001386C450|nr:DUF2298 domain-containing protein [Tengunoibacter tsumagoiensis]